MGSALITILSGCASLRFTRINTNQVTGLSGRCNDTDSRVVATAMIEEVTQGSWLTRFQQAKTTPEKPVDRYGKPRPAIMIGAVLNKSREHIASDTFIKDLEKAVIKEREVRIVANSALREKLRQERGVQAGFASPKTEKHFGRELGADYMLFGIINTAEKRKVLLYQVALERSWLTNNGAAWMEYTELRKLLKRKR